jgi:hypothetical protein
LPIKGAAMRCPIPVGSEAARKAKPRGKGVAQKQPDDFSSLTVIDAGSSERITRHPDIGTPKPSFTRAMAD